MTKEELKQKAEEYVGKNGFGSDYNNIISFEANSEMEKAYIAGATENGIQWHDLRKDPNDLPNTDRDVWVKRESEEKEQLDNYYNDEVEKGWGIMFREGYSTDDVIAWCEIPKFEEE